MLLVLSLSPLTLSSDSPSLKIFTKPDPVFQHYKGNLSVICNVRRSGNQGNPVSKVYLRVMKGSTNATTSYTVVRPTLAKPLNVSLVAVYNDFVNESSLFIECIAWMDTGGCTSRLKSVVFTSKLYFCKIYRVCWDVYRISFDFLSLHGILILFVNRS